MEAKENEQTENKQTVVPDYETECCICGQTPTVAVYVGDKLECHTTLCGAHCWGEADCIDPDNW